MRLTFLQVISSLYFFNHISHALPLRPQAFPEQPAVQRRIAYSVVAVDGGLAAMTPATPETDTLTIIQTSDIIETVTAPASSTPPSIETFVVTKTVSESEPAKTVFTSLSQDVTKTPPPTKTPWHMVIDPTLSSTVPVTSQTFTTVSIGNCLTLFSTSTLTLSSSYISSSVPTGSHSLASSNKGSESVRLPEAKHPEAKGPEAAVSISASPPPLVPSITKHSTSQTSSTKTYDDGMWHTSYPVWNATSTVLSSTLATAVGSGRAQKLWKKG